MRRRALILETLEHRSLLASLPFGATPSDTGEYMLGEVLVNVVLMESDPTRAPYDNNPSNAAVHPGIGAPIEDWTSEAIAAVKANVQTGVQWWKDTLHNVFPNAPVDVLDFKFNWTYADNPVRTGYEPIARKSNDFALWAIDFLNTAHYSNIRAFNDAMRQQYETDWSYTIFVVNNANDPDKAFASGGQFSLSFAYPGGLFEVIPSSRPAYVYAHEMGHVFWAFDEYDDSTGPDYLDHRGYYDTQNLNSADNPAPGFVQQPSIMAGGTWLVDGYVGHTSSAPTLAIIGWKDSDQDGIFDVLDVPFSLDGSGQYDASKGLYVFNGSTSVNTLPNLNPVSLGNDITINQIRLVEYKIDDGPWTPIQSFPARTYQTELKKLQIPVPTGLHEIRIRSSDPRTGVKSNEFIGETDGPTGGGPGISGVVFLDKNSDGGWDSGEPALPGVGIDLIDIDDQVIDLKHFIDPIDLGTPDIDDGATLSAIGGGVSPSNSGVIAVDSMRTSAGLVFGSNNQSDIETETWNDARKLKISFNEPVSYVSIDAYGGSTSGLTYGRLEAYNEDGSLVARITTGGLGTGASTKMTLRRVAGDISYVLAYGHAQSYNPSIDPSIVLDHLEWGPSASATTNVYGAYSLGYLPDGTYRVQVTPSAGYFLTTPEDGIATISVTDGMTVGSVNFGIGTSHNPFNNPENAYNVDDDAQNIVSPIDALMVINYLNAHNGEGEISPTLTPNDVGYIDVDDDGICAPIDALMVINFLNSQPRSPGGEPAMVAPSDGGAPPAGEPSANTPTISSGSSTANLSSNAALLAAQVDSADANASSPSRPTQSKVTSISTPPVARRHGTLLSDTRKQAQQVAGTSPKIETTLDEIAADVSQADAAALRKRR